MSGEKDSMIVIVDNGKGAEDIARFIRAQKTIVKPKDAASAKGSAYILSDGDLKNQRDNVKLIEKTNKPLLGIGAGYVFLGAAFGAKAVPTKGGKIETVKIERPSPLTLDMKKMFSVVQTVTHGFQDLPENFNVFASSSKYEFKIIQENEKPFFGVHFNPEQGSEGIKILDNFCRFVEIWEKYHR